jgi:RNA polymerase subunit RPABC4/transcription elongation factor Spt4
MKFCYQCGRITPGEPFFCNFCGRSYDVKLCPRLHANSRSAEVCAQCGSRDFSTPQPRVSVWWRVLEFVTKVVFGAFLAYLSVAGLIALLRTPQFQSLLIIFGILVGLLWWLWSLLPEWFQKLVRRSIRRKEQRHDR